MNEDAQRPLVDIDALVAAAAATPEPHRRAVDLALVELGWRRARACGESEDRLAALLRAVGERGRCRGCGADVYWVRHLNGRRAPYTPSGLNHFVDCPAAAQFRNAQEARP